MSIVQKGAMNLQEGIFPCQERFLLMLSEVLTGQNSLQREQRKDIDPFYNLLSSKSHQAHFIVLIC